MEDNGKPEANLSSLENFEFIASIHKQFQIYTCLAQLTLSLDLLCLIRLLSITVSRNTGL
jgi:hypothetical protein